MTQTPKLIVYDWNGTLIDDTALVAACFSAVIAPWGLPPLTAETFRRHYDVPWHDMYKNLGASEDQIASLGGHALGQGFFDQYEAGIASVSLYPGTEALLRKVSASGARQIVLSNTLIGHLQGQIDRFGIGPCFEALLAYKDFSPTERQATKKDKLRDYLLQTQTPPAQAIIVGDTPEEIRMGKELGLTSIALAYGYASRARMERENPDMLAATPQEFTKIVKTFL